MDIYFLINQIVDKAPVRVVFNIIKELDLKCFNVKIIQLRSHKEDVLFKDKFKLIGVEFIDFTYSFLDLELKTNKCVCEINSSLLENNIVIHSHGYQPTIILNKLSKINKNIYSVNTIHSCITQDYVRSKGLILGLFMCIRFLLNLNHFKELVCVSKTVVDYYKKLLSNKNRLKLSCIYNGIDTDIFKNRTNEKIDFRKKIGIPEDTLLFISIGNLSSLKNSTFIAKSFEKFRAENLAIYTTLLFIGEGELKDELSQLSDNIRCVGFKSNVSDYIQASDCVISASKTEGFGLTFIEAIACGKPFLYSSIPVFLELSTHFPGCELFNFNNNDMSDLVRKMELILHKEYDNLLLVRNSYLVNETFTMELTSQSYQKIYRKVYGNNI